jgi:hypothetical protein
VAGKTEGGGMDPMHQFEVQPIIELPALAGIDTSFTNSSLWMVLAVGLSGMFMLMASSRTALVPGRLQLMGEMAYGFVANMIKENVGTEGMRFFPFIFSLFLFILVLQHARHAALQLHRNQPFDCHLCARRRGVCHGDGGRFHPPWYRVLEIIRAVRHSGGHGSIAGDY